MSFSQHLLQCELPDLAASALHLESILAAGSGSRRPDAASLGELREQLSLLTAADAAAARAMNLCQATTTLAGLSEDMSALADGDGVQYVHHLAGEAVSVCLQQLRLALLVIYSILPADERRGSPSYAINLVIVQLVSVLAHRLLHLLRGVAAALPQGCGSYLLADEQLLARLTALLCLLLVVPACPLELDPAHLLGGGNERWLLPEQLRDRFRDSGSASLPDCQNLGVWESGSSATAEEVLEEVRGRGSGCEQMVIVQLAKWWDLSSSHSTSSGVLTVLSLAAAQHLLRGAQGISATVWTCLVPQCLHLLDSGSTAEEVRGLQALWELGTPEVEVVQWVAPALLLRTSSEHPLVALLCTSLLHRWALLHPLVHPLAHSLLAQITSSLLCAAPLRVWPHLLALPRLLGGTSEEVLSCHAVGLASALLSALGLRHLPVGLLAARALRLLLQRTPSGVLAKRCGLEVCTEVVRAVGFGLRPSARDLSLATPEEVQTMQAELRGLWADALGEGRGAWLALVHPLGGGEVEDEEVPAGDRAFLLRCIEQMDGQ